MCNSCGKNAPLTIVSTPIEISFTVTLLKSGKLRRNSDFKGSQKFDPDQFESNLDRVSISCTNCGNPVDISTLTIVKSCTLCDSKDIFDCAYNQMTFCLGCAKKHLTYCSMCPLKQDCKLGALNVNSSTRS